MITLTDLANRPKKTRAKLFHSVHGGITALRTHNAATAANSNGAINIWRGRDGLLRGERFARCCSRSKITTKTYVQLRFWLEQEFPLIA